MKRPRRIKIIIGTRGSDLALRQTGLVVDALQKRWSDLNFEIKIITTRGDDEKTAITDVRAGRKGLFTGAIERELTTGKIDIAVHSAKDLPSALAPKTEIAAVLPRGGAGDVLVTTRASDLTSLPGNAIVATGSVRRQHQLRWKRPDLEIVDLRGNVPTRLRKLAIDRWHAVVLAEAGLQRLGLGLNGEASQFEGANLFMTRLPRDVFVPAGGQGIIAVQMRSDNEPLREIVGAVSDFDTRLSLRAEREFLRLLHADCNQPVGVFADIEGAMMTLRAQIFELGATTPREGIAGGASEDAEKLAARLFEQING